MRTVTGRLQEGTVVLFLAHAPETDGRERRRTLLPRLAAALELAEDGLHWSHGTDGAPRLTGQPWSASLAHTRDHSVCALAAGPVGVDAEPRDRSARSAARVAARFAADQRLATLGHDGEPDPALVAAVWVRKEAVLKAARRGLDAGVGTLPVPTAPPPTAGWCDGPLGRWHVRDVLWGPLLVAIATDAERDVVLLGPTDP